MIISNMPMPSPSPKWENSAARPRPAAMPARGPSHLLPGFAGAAVCAGAACAGAASADFCAGALMVRCLPKLRPPPNLAASAFAASKERLVKTMVRKRAKRFMRFLMSGWYRERSITAGARRQTPLLSGNLVGFGQQLDVVDKIFSLAETRGRQPFMLLVNQRDTLPD